MQISSLQMDSNVFSLGAILGTAGSQQLLDNINQQYGAGSYFGSMSDPFRTGFANFMNTVINPIRQAQQTLYQTSQQLFNNENAFRPITSVEDLQRGIPPCMMLPIIYHPELHQQLIEERIDGFGLDPNTLENYDPYHDVLTSGILEFNASELDKNGGIDMKWVQSTDDPVLTPEELHAVRETRAFIDDFVQNEATQHLDFTAYPNLKA